VTPVISDSQRLLAHWHRRPNSLLEFGASREALITLAVLTHTQDLIFSRNSLLWGSLNAWLEQLWGLHHLEFTFYPGELFYDYICSACFLLGPNWRHLDPWWWGCQRHLIAWKQVLAGTSQAVSSTWFCHTCPVLLSCGKLPRVLLESNGGDFYYTVATPVNDLFYNWILLSDLRSLCRRCQQLWAKTPTGFSFESTVWL
jgi:hypothetical protein